MQRAIRTTSTLRRLWRQYLWRAAQWHVGAIANTHTYTHAYVSLWMRVRCRLCVATDSMDSSACQAATAGSNSHFKVLIRICIDFHLLPMQIR